MANRTSQERITEALHRLETEPNVWVATASMDGLPHSVPLSLAWDGSAIVVATPTESPTVRNLVASAVARASLDSADDVVILDTAAAAHDLATVDSGRVEAYIERVGWDPRTIGGSWSLLTLTPTRVQSWNGPNEISGRTIMRKGIWVS